MKEEYKIEILMTPHVRDNLKQPYFWVIMKTSINNNWINTGSCGWSKTPEEAWSKASKEYNACYKEWSEI